MPSIKSKALEVNIADYHIEVEIDSRYQVIMDMMSRYYGLAENLETFLKELSHPYKNWQFIVREARGYSLDYFHLMKAHPQGVAAADLFIEMFLTAAEKGKEESTRSDAAENLLLFIQKMIHEAGDSLGQFVPILEKAFGTIAEFDNQTFLRFVTSYCQVRRLALVLLKYPRDVVDRFPRFSHLLDRYYRDTFALWLSEKDLRQWVQNEMVDASQDFPEDIFCEIDHQRLREHVTNLDNIGAASDLSVAAKIRAFSDLPGYSQIVEIYRNIPQKLVAGAPKDILRNRWKVFFLFHIMNLSGLTAIHEEALRDINRTLTWLISNERPSQIYDLIKKTFSILQEWSDKYPATALNCALNMGRGVYETDESELINYFMDSVIDMGFQTPMIGGVGNDWQIKVNPAHILNMRTWLEIIGLNPKWSSRLMSALTIYLSLGGVFIKDNDLFPRDITRLLNSNIEPVYNLVKQLSRLFPTFFNDIGAEGKLRDISTKLDEMTHRKDILIHFLRKQSHVESSNRIIGFMEAVMGFWKNRDKSVLSPYVPPNIYEQIACRGEYVDGVSRVLCKLEEMGIRLPDDLLILPEDEIRSCVEDEETLDSVDIERVLLAAAFYNLLHQKYNLDFVGMGQYLIQIKSSAFPELKKLKQAIAEPDLKKKLSMLLDYLGLLKDVILSDQVYEIREDIYKKRHITVDIPSMYGSYREMKFDAMGLTFRIESLVNVLFEDFIAKIDLSLITQATFFQISKLLRLFGKALELDGISSVEFERQLDLLTSALEVKGFSFTQYLDIFKGFAQAVKNIINDYFHNLHDRSLTRVLTDMPVNHLLPKYFQGERPPDVEKHRHMVSEIFFRDRMVLSLGLQQLDMLLSRILNTLFNQANKLPKERLHVLLNYDLKRAMTSLAEENKKVSGIVYLGNKGLNMVRLKELNLPVPPGFIITTEVFRSYEIITTYEPAEQNLREQIAYHISRLEQLTGKRFGDTINPLLFSVRSGSSISQPGMMDTFLNVGINEEIAAGMADRTKNAWFAWDSYRRFLQGYGMAFNLERNAFDEIIHAHKKKLAIPLKRGFSGQQMCDIAMAYKDMIRDAGIKIVEDPFDQLFLTIQKVFASWESPKAKTYRKIMGISDDWGTAVTVQSMVFGNISPDSGSGVIFTHNPRWSGDTMRLWGDFTLGNQGEDVVSGLVNTMPISMIQQEIEMRDTDITLESHFPDIYGALKDWASFLIYDEKWSPQEMEFTFEGPGRDQLFLLQTRDMAIRDAKKVIAFDPDGISEDCFLGNGIGVSGGAMSGRAVFSLQEIDRWRSVEPDTALILIRGDTVPEDIREIHAADGLLTARGGLTSHAAVVAHRLGKTCVVGCGALVCDESRKTLVFNKTLLKSGDSISIDGKDGAVYQGLLRVRKSEAALPV